MLRRISSYRGPSVTSKISAIFIPGKIAERGREREQLFGAQLRRLELGLAGRIDEHRRVHVALAPVAPCARAQPAASRDLLEALETLAEALDRKHHVLRDLGAAHPGHHAV